MREPRPGHRHAGPFVSYPVVPAGNEPDGISFAPELDFRGTFLGFGGAEARGWLEGDGVGTTGEDEFVGGGEAREECLAVVFVIELDRGVIDRLLAV